MRLAWISRSVRESSAEGGFVEQQDRRRFQDRSGNGDALLLAAGELQPALPDLGLIAVGQSGDEVVDMRQVRRILDLRPRCAGLAVADIVFDRVV